MDERQARDGQRVFIVLTQKPSTALTPAAVDRPAWWGCKRDYGEARFTWHGYRGADGCLYGRLGRTRPARRSSDALAPEDTGLRPGGFQWYRIEE